VKTDRRMGWLLFVLCLILVPIVFRNNSYFLIILILCGINVIMASSVRTIASVGQICMGSMAFSGVGAYTSAILTLKAGLPFWVAFPCAGLACLIVAAVIAFPFVRVTGVYFAMLTLFLGEVVRLIIVEWDSLTGGVTGLSGIPPVGPLDLFGLTVDFGNLLPYCYLVFAVMLVTLFILYRIDRSFLATTLAAIEGDEDVSESIGIHVIKYKMIAFCIGSFFFGLAGSLLAHYMRLLNADTFSLFGSIYVLIYMVVGGRKKFAGPAVGAIVLTLVPEMSRVLKQYQPLIFVAVLFFVLYVMRGGLAEIPDKIRSYYQRMRARRIDEDKAREERPPKGVPHA
jgi:branched-chain amino acid transport system permease protein